VFFASIVPSPKFQKKFVMGPTVAKLDVASNFKVAPATKTSPFGLITLTLKMAKGGLMVIPEATETDCPLIVTTTGTLLVAGAVREKVAGWKVKPLPATRTVVPMIPACVPDPTNVMPTVPVITLTATLPHLTVSEVLAGTESIEAPPHTLMLVGVRPPAMPDVTRMPTLGDTSCNVSWQGIVGHWSPLETIVP